jgi:hypothetical protein
MSKPTPSSYVPVLPRILTGCYSFDKEVALKGHFEVIRAENSPPSNEHINHAGRVDD